MLRQIGRRLTRLAPALLLAASVSAVLLPLLDGQISLFYGFILAPVALLGAAGAGLWLSARQQRQCQPVRAAAVVPLQRRPGRRLCREFRQHWWGQHRQAG